MSEAKERWKIREIILVYFEKQSAVDLKDEVIRDERNYNKESDG